MGEMVGGENEGERGKKNGNPYTYKKRVMENNSFKIVH